MENWNYRLVKLCSEQWSDAMLNTDNFSAEIRSKEEVDKHEEKNVKGFDCCMGQSEERVETALECIRKRGYLEANMKALDIGAGTGIFTIPFAERYKSVTSLDISQPMQQRVMERAAERGLKNIEYRIINWKEADIEKEKLDNQFDLVLSSINCRGVCSFETLSKMNEASRGGCCLMTWAGHSVSNHTEELQRLIIGRKLETAGGNDIVFPFNIIYHLGGMPDLAYSKISWERRMRPEEAVESICFGYWRFADITAEIRSRIEQYVMNNLEDGCYVDCAEHRIGIMVWDAWRIKNQHLQ